MSDSKPISILEAAPSTESGDNHAKMPKAVIATVVAVLLIAAVALYFSLRRNDFPGYTYVGNSAQHDRIYINLGSMQFVGGLLHAKVLFKPHASEEYDYQIADFATNCSGNDTLSAATRFRANGAPIESTYQLASAESSAAAGMVSKFACARSKDIVTIPANKSGGMQPSDIENMTYVFGTGLDSRSIKFIDGKARWDTDTCGIDKKSIVYGNLQGNAERAAVLVMGCGGGGSGDFRSLVAVWNANGTLVNSAEKELGDRIVVNSIAISDGIVTVDMLTQGPTDGMCCPTQRKILRLALQGNQLVDVQVKNQLTTPTRIPKDIKKVTEKEARPTQGFGGANMEGMGRSDSGVMGSVFGSDNAPKVKTVPQHINISNDVAVGLLLQKTQPIYPPIAMAARVSGTVVLQVTISKTGTITNLHVVSGPAMLQQAAMDAVKTWRYRPYLLNNEPVEVETTINVFFSLGG